MQLKIYRCLPYLLIYTNDMDANPNAAVTLRILARRIASGNGGYYK